MPFRGKSCQRPLHVGQDFPRDGLATEDAIRRRFCTNFAINVLIVDMYTLQRVSIQESPYIKPDTAMP